MTQDAESALDGEADHPVKWAEVDSRALTRNAASIAAHVGSGVRVMAVVKANGYGHGAVVAARSALAGGAQWLAVSNAEEALHLRRAGLDAPLLILGWTHPATQPALVQAGVDLTVWNEDALRSVDVAARTAGRPARVHLEVDTGMHRVGAAPQSLGGMASLLNEVSDTVELAGIYTHFADADGADPEFTQDQLARFLAAAERFRDDHPGALLHAANSAGTLRFPSSHLDMVRPGLALYGYAPENCGGIIEMSWALTVCAVVTHVTTVRAGETVGYNRRWKATVDTRVAVVAAGYADGIQRAQSNRGAVLVRGVRCPILGLVSMDQISVDVSRVSGVAAGEIAVILGGDERRGMLGADEVAAAGGTRTYEVLCAVSARVPRRVVA